MSLCIPSTSSTSVSTPRKRIPSRESLSPFIELATSVSLTPGPSSVETPTDERYRPGRETVSVLLKFAMRMMMDGSMMT